MYARDARGGMRSVLTESNQIPLSYQKSGSRWSPRRAHGNVAHRLGGQAINTGWSRAQTPSEYDTLPRGDIGGPPRLSEQQRSMSHFSLPPATIPSSMKARNRNMRHQSSHRYSENELLADYGRISNRNRDNAGLRSHRRNNQPLEHGITARNSQKENQRRLNENTLAATKGSFAARVDRPRSLTPDGRMSARSNGSINRKKSHLIPKPEAAWKHSQARLDERYSSMGYNTPSLVNGREYNSRASRFTPSPALQYNGRRNFEATHSQVGNRQYMPGREYTAVDPQLEEAERRNKQYYVGVNLNAASSHPGFNNSVSQLDHMNGSRMSLRNGSDSRYGLEGRYNDTGFHNSRINLVDYNPLRPSSRSVSVMQLGNDRGTVYGSRSVLDGYDENLIEDSYVVDVKGSKSRPTSRMMISNVTDSRERPSGDETVEFDFELVGVDGGTRPIAGVGVMNGAPISIPRPSTALSEYRHQNTASRLSSYTLAGQERWLTMKRDDTLMMDYQPTEPETVRIKSRNSRPASRADSRNRGTHRSTSFMDKTRESFSRQRGTKAQDERNVPRKKSWNSRPTSRVGSQRFSRASNRFPSYEEDTRSFSRQRDGDGNKMREKSWYGSTGSLGDSRRHRWSHRIKSYDDNGEIVRDESWHSRPTSRVDSQRFSRASNRFPSYEEDRKPISPQRERDQDNRLREKSFYGSTGSIGDIQRRRRTSYRISYDDDNGSTTEPVSRDRERAQNGGNIVREESWQSRPTSHINGSIGDIQRRRRTSYRISYDDNGDEESISRKEKQAQDAKAREESQYSRPTSRIDSQRFSRASNRFPFYEEDRKSISREGDLIRDESNKIREKSWYGSTGSIGDLQRRRRTSYRISYDDDDENQRETSDLINREREMVHDEIDKVREELSNSRPISRIDSHRYSRASNRFPSYEEDRYSTSRQGRLAQDERNRERSWNSRPTSRIDSQRLSRASHRSTPYQVETRNSISRLSQDEDDKVEEESWYSSSTGSDGETRRHHVVVRRARSYDDEEEEETRETISRLNQVAPDDLKQEKELLEHEKRQLREDMEDERRRLAREIDKMHHEQERAEDERQAERKTRDREREGRYEEEVKNRW